MTGARQTATSTKTTALTANTSSKRGTCSQWSDRLRRGHGIARAAILPLLAISLVAAGCGAIDRDDEAKLVAPSGSASNTEPGFATGSGMDGAIAPGAPPMPDTAGRPEESFGEGSASFPGSAQGTDIQNTLGRSVIRNGHIELVVESVEDAFQRVRQLTDATGGYVSASTFTGGEDSQRAYLTLRIPAEEFDATIERLRGLAIEVPTASTTSQDVTEEYTDLQAHLRTQRAVEEQYLTLLGEATQIGDILQIQERLSYTRYEIERIQGRLNFLDSLTSLATLEVSLLPESDASTEPVAPSFGDRVQEAWEDSLATLGAAGTGIVLAIVWGWWLLPVALVAAIVIRRVARAQSTNRQTTPVEASGDSSGHVDTPDGAA